ncbi:MAG: DUF4177 domain-containing protein [Thermoproteota archaeon]|nr:DUF4177 domain-containing protein [Acidobacteriota bacterium]MDQ3903321.1 DUF4177 domain-containing protein [Thermoproteota archaeon]
MSNVKCPNCGLVNFAADDTCKRCGNPLPISQERPAEITQESVPPISKPNPEYSTFMPQQNPMNKVQGYIIIGLLCIGLVLLSWGVFRPQPKYEYKVVSFLTESNDRTGGGALKFSSVKVDEAQLASMGAEGWELVGTFLEMETAYPNFGSSEYVTGLQPNVRPQRAVLIFKRQAK